jgi:hypothetical protein
MMLTRLLRFRVIAIACLLAACSLEPARRDIAHCTMSPEDAAWRRSALAAWDVTSHRILNVEAAAEPPTIVFFDETCVYRSEKSGDWQSAPHEGAIPLPGGQTVPPRVTSFAAPYDRDRRAFLAMALPTVWAADGVTSPLGLDTLMTAVFVHEMTHTRQFYYFARRLAEATARYGLPDDLDDDAVQTRFEGVPEFSADIDDERDLLFAAAAAPESTDVRHLARRVLARMEARRARYFVGDDAKYGELEDLFLTMEGVAQWASYRWLIDPRGGGLTGSNALDAFRRGGRRWSQDEGIALYLVIDRLVSDWRRQAFADRPASALELLAMGVSPGRRSAGKE